MHFVGGGITGGAKHGVFWMVLVSRVGGAQEMVMIGTAWWIVAAGVALLSVLAFLAGNGMETYRSRRLLSRLAKERRDLEKQRRELAAGWDELDARWDELEAEQAGTTGDAAPPSTHQLDAGHKARLSRDLRIA